MHKLASIFALTFMALLLSACPRPVRPPASPSAQAPADTRGAVVYKVSAADSEIQIHVYRGGALARFGHNHVVTSKTTTGRVWIHPTLETSGFELSLPVAELIVDDPAARVAAGPDFTAPVPKESRESTRANMLRESVLDAARFPVVSIAATKIAGVATSPQVIARVTLRNVSQDVKVAPQVSLAGDHLTVNGSFEILQTDFGVTPFSAALGALQVQDRLVVTFHIVAIRQARALTVSSARPHSRA